MTLYVINPLSITLAHYEKALLETISEVEVVVIRNTEPSFSQRGSLFWFLKYLRSLFLVRIKMINDCKARLLVIWPVVGFLDLILLRLFGLSQQSALVVHDPTPMVRARGYSKIGRIIATISNQHTKLIAHSHEANVELSYMGFAQRTRVLTHPVCKPSSTTNSYPVPKNLVLRVIGQYKKTRDVDLLQKLSERLPEDSKLEICGRGWPEVSGWERKEGFLTEVEIDQLIATSTAILIPYLRFYQSGIAVRAVELGVPVIGNKRTNLQDFYPENSLNLVEVSDSIEAWLHAIKMTQKQSHDSYIDSFKDVYLNNLTQWNDFIRSWN